MKFGIHVGFGLQISNLKFCVDRMIGFQDMGFFFENLEKIRGSAQLQNTIARERSVFCGNTVCKKRSTLSASSVKSLVVVNSTSKNKLT